jgi:type I restriction enzyme S subunit
MKFALPLPPYAEQKRIVAKVDSIFKLIDQLAQAYKSEQTERSKLVASSLAQLAKGEVGANDSLALAHIFEIIRTKADAKILRQTILHLAVSGQLVPQDPSEGSGEELYRKIQSEKANLVKKGTLKKQKLLKNITESETPFTIPSSWKWARLADIGQVVGGGTPSSSNVSYYTSEIDGGIPWLTPADLRGYKDMYITRGARNITKAGLQNSSARLLPKNTILFSSRAPIGHLAIAANELATNQGFKSVVPYSEMVPEYIYRWLQFYAPVIDANASGTTFREVSGAIVERQLIPLPPFDEQKRIVTKTTQLLNLITELEEHLVD